jgi:hypothetical protein
LEFYELLEQWTLKQNRQAAPIARVTAVLLNMFAAKDSPSVDIESLLPFPPSPTYLNNDQSIAVLDRYFGAISKGALN